MSKNKNKTNLYPWYLHYNPYTEMWNGVPRDKAGEYLNGTLSENDVIKNKNINVIINYIETNT